VKKTSVIYYAIALVLILYLLSQAIPFLGSLMPGLKLFLLVFPVIFLLLTHFTPGEIMRAFRLAGRRSTGTPPEYRNALLMFRTAQNLFAALMLIGAVVLVVFFLGIGPQSRHVAQPVAIIVGGFFWPLIFILFLCLPFRSAIRKKLNEISGREGERDG